MTCVPAKYGGKTPCAGSGVGSGVGSGSTAWESTWTTLYDQDFSTLPDADILPGGDQDITIDGKAWFARNSAKMGSLDVGPAVNGLKLGLTSDTSASDYFNGARTSPALEADLYQFIEGTDFEGRSDIELRVTWEPLLDALSSTIYEQSMFGVEQKAYDASKRFQLYQGSQPPSTVKRRFHTNFAGTKLAGDETLDDADLDYFPNVLAIEMRENFVCSLYSASGASNIGDELNRATTYQLSAPYLFVDPTGNTRHFLYFSMSKSAGAPTATHLTLVGLRVEARFSPRGIGVRIP